MKIILLLIVCLWGAGCANLMSPDENFKLAKSRQSNVESKGFTFYAFYNGFESEWEGIYARKGTKLYKISFISDSIDILDVEVIENAEIVKE